MTTTQQIDLWRSLPSETQNIEFKEAKTQFDNKKLYRYCVAIANEGGGQLILGVANKSPRPVVGTAAFNDPVEMASKLFTAVGFRVDIEEVAHQDGRVVVFHIPSRLKGTAYHYEGTSKLQTKADTTGRKGYAVGFQGLVRHVMTQLPQNEVIEGALRVESKLLPEVVIRELLANALIHQDFEESGMSPMIEIYTDRVEISNPGEPIVPVDRFIDGYQSRNERMADLMRRFGICEEKSSGIDRVIEAAEIHQLPAPDFQVGFKRTMVVLFGPRSFKKMERADRIRACYQHCVLHWVLRRQMSNQTLRERFRLSESSTNTVSQIITAAMDAGLIKLDPNAPVSRKYARYLPIWA